jgi:hypothetical protein
LCQKKRGTENERGHGGQRKTCLFHSCP